jgi:hypothetical protein
MTSALLVAMTLTITPGMTQFINRVYDFVELHRRAAAGIEQPLCSDPEGVARQADALANAIRIARPRAKEGDIFTMAASEMFRTKIAAIIRRTDFDVAAFLARHAYEGDEMDVQVFGTLDWHTHLALTPLVRELPALPPELEYQFVGRDLVLVDVAANMVVDVLRDALPLPADAPTPVATSSPCSPHPELEGCWM